MLAIERFGSDTIRFERILDAPREAVWRYLAEADLRRQWFAGGSDMHAGETVELVFDHDNLSTDDVAYPERYAKGKGAVGRERVVAFDPPRLLAISWDGGKEGVAEFELFDMGDRTRLVLTHSGISGPAPMANFGGGWHSHLAVLQGLFSGNRVRDFWTLHAQSEAAIAKALG